MSSCICVHVTSHITCMFLVVKVFQLNKANVSFMTEFEPCCMNRHTFKLSETIIVSHQIWKPSWKPKTMDLVSRNHDFPNGGVIQKIEMPTIYENCSTFPTGRLYFHMKKGGSYWSWYIRRLSPPRRRSTMCMTLLSFTPSFPNSCESSIWNINQNHWQPILHRKIVLLIDYFYYCSARLLTTHFRCFHCQLELHAGVPSSMVLSQLTNFLQPERIT